MRPWTRLQDFATLIAGAYAALSPIWVNTTGERDAFWTLIALGALLALASLGAIPASNRAHRQAIQHQPRLPHRTGPAGIGGPVRLPRGALRPRRR